MTKITYTDEELSLLADACHDLYHRKLRNYKPTLAAHLRQCELAYSDHVVTVLCYDSLPQRYIDKLQAQLREAESRGYKSAKPLLLFLHEFTADDNIGGGMSPFGETRDGHLVAVMGVNTDPAMSGLRNTKGELTAMEHEYWHLIDYAGNHSGVWSQPLDPKDVDHNSQAAVLAHIQQDMGRGSLSSGTLVRALRNVEIETFKQYSDQPHELWVHHRMCESAGLTPRSIEGYHRSHNIMFNVMGYLNAMPELGVARSTCRKAAQQFALEITQDRKGFLEEMRVCGYGWLFT